MAFFQIIRVEVSSVMSGINQQKGIASGLLDTLKSYVPKVQAAWIGGDADEFAADFARKIVQAMVASLRAASFASFGTSAALAQYYDVIRQKIDNLSKLCTEFSGDLSNAINDHKKGDVQGKRYFGEGVSR